MKKRGLLIPVDGPAREIEIDGLDDMQDAVGGMLDVVGDAFGPWVDAWVNDEGLLLGLAPNFAHPLDTVQNGGDATEVLCGPVLVLGANADGESVGLTDEQVAAVNARLPAAIRGSEAGAAGAGQRGEGAVPGPLRETACPRGPMQHEGRFLSPSRGLAHYPASPGMVGRVFDQNGCDRKNRESVAA